MLSPQLSVLDLRDQPGMLRVTDTTTGYGVSGNPTRSDITQASLEISRYTPAGHRISGLATLPLPSIVAGTPVDVPYAEGHDLSGDGLIVLTYSLYSTVGAPLTVATYTTDHAAPFNTDTQQLFVRKNGALVRLMDQSTSAGWQYAVTNTTDVYTDWRIIDTVSGRTVSNGFFIRSGAFWSDTVVSSTPRPTPILIARSAQPLLLLSRTRRRLNQLSERLVYDERTPMPQHLADSLMWLRLYERLEELAMNDVLDHSPTRVQIAMADLHVMLNDLWLRHG